MFRLNPPTAAEVARKIVAAGEVANTEYKLLEILKAGSTTQLPFTFAYDASSSCMGCGMEAFRRARLAFSQWAMFDIDWVRVANPTANIREGQVVAVEAHTLGMWTLNLSKIISVTDEPVDFGFVYATTAEHVEEGVEQFLLSFDRISGDVVYSLKAISRPRANLARIGLPISRFFQHRFARDSHRRMRQAIEGSAG